MKTFSFVTLLVISIVCIGCKATSVETPTMPLNFTGLVVKHENGNPMQDVRVELYRVKPGFFHEISEQVTQTITDETGSFTITAEVEEDSCEEWTYGLSATLHLVRAGDQNRDTAYKSINCTSELQEFTIRLKREQIGG